MASVTHDKLTWIYTNYGLRRVTEVMQNPDDKLAITKLVVGDSEVITYDEVTGIPIYHYDYYTPDPAQDNLKHPVDSFFFHGKDLLIIVVVWSANHFYYTKELFSCLLLPSL